jgi:hypothetical protein
VSGVVITDPVLSTIRGAEDAEALILTIQDGCAVPDALHEALQAVVGGGDPDQLRGFARKLQKTLERAVAAA